MKLFTLNLDTVLPGADYGVPFYGLTLSTELIASQDCVIIPDQIGPRFKLIKASIEVWNSGRYLVPERTPGTALVVLDLPQNSHITVTGAERIDDRLVRLVGSQSCVIEQRYMHTTGPNRREPSETRKSIFNLAFTGCFLKVERNGKPMQPDNVIL